MKDFFNVSLHLQHCSLKLKEMKQTKIIKLLGKIFLPYDTDDGFAKICIFVILYAFGSLIASSLFLKAIFFQPLFIIIIYSFLLSWTKRINQQNILKILVSHSFAIMNVMWFYYSFVGDINLYAGGLALYDQYMLNVDLFIFKVPVATFFYNLFKDLGLFTNIIYDLLMYAYVTYYILPLWCLVEFFIKFKGKNSSFFNLKKMMSDQDLNELNHFTASVIIFLVLVFSFYLVIPVTGPQYYLKNYFLTSLPFFPLGNFLYNLIYELHPNFIDCFPSGHAGLSLLVTYWMFKWQLPSRHVIMLVTLLIILATVVLKFHYGLDIVASLPFIAVSLFMSEKMINK